MRRGDVRGECVCVGGRCYLMTPYEEGSRVGILPSVVFEEPQDVQGFPYGDVTVTEQLGDEFACSREG